LAGVGARGASGKFMTHNYFFSATSETSNFKFGTQLGFGE